MRRSDKHISKIHQWPNGGWTHVRTGHEGDQFIRNVHGLLIETYRADGGLISATYWECGPRLRLIGQARAANGGSCQGCFTVIPECTT